MPQHSPIPNLTPTTLQTLRPWASPRRRVVIPVSRPHAALLISNLPPQGRCAPAGSYLSAMRGAPAARPSSAQLGPPEPRGALRGAAETKRGVRSLPRASQNVAAPGPPRPPPEKPRPQAGHWWEGGRAANGRRRRTAEGWRREAARGGPRPLGVGPRCEGAQRSAPAPQRQRRWCPLLRQPGGGSNGISRCFSFSHCLWANLNPGVELFLWEQPLSSGRCWAGSHTEGLWGGTGVTDTQTFFFCHKTARTEGHRY